MSATVVVGVDGSEASEAALRWAHDAALLRGARLQAVHAWSLPYVGDMSAMAAVADRVEVFRQAADRQLSSTVDTVLGGKSGVEVVKVLVEGAPAPTLIDAARDADLLVVGSRGHGGFAGLLLGSVSQHCARHATCPVVVVRPDTGPPGGDASGR
jgi:nucleotide-binding universal stress UspA family protein